MVTIKSTYLLLLLVTLGSCQSDPLYDKQDSVDYRTIKEKIHRRHHDFTYKVESTKQKVRELYPWEVGRVENLAPITKEFFRCRGYDLNPVKIFEQNGEVITLHDCGGRDHHGLPVKTGKEFIYPILIDLLNYVQVKTKKKVVITSGHRCPKHNSYVDPSHNNLYSKHQLGAEVSFYVEGMESQPEMIVSVLQQYYLEESLYREKQEYREFKRYEKNDTNVSHRPWMNKEIFIKLFNRFEGRNFDNQHPYAYISIQVRYDPLVNENVIYTWKKAHIEFMKK